MHAKLRKFARKVRHFRAEVSKFSEGSKIRTEGSKFLEGSKFRKLDISQPDTLHTTRNRTLRIFDGAKSDTLNTPSKSDTLNTAPDTLRECLAPTPTPGKSEHFRAGDEPEFRAGRQLALPLAGFNRHSRAVARRNRINTEARSAGRRKLAPTLSGGTWV